jgi:sialate O-acetylesterase
MKLRTHLLHAPIVACRIQLLKSIPINYFFMLFLMLPLISQAQNAPAKLKLPALIGDNMLLQQKTNAKIWGKAAPGQKIQVTASWKANGEAVTGKDGKWQVELSTPAAGGPYTMTIASNDTMININNVLIGEVWLCSGQSNMEMPLAGWPPNDTIEHSKSAISAAANNHIRLFNVQRALAYEPLDECTGKWEVCNTSTVQSFSATAYFFGRTLYDELKIPIGLIESTWGGTPVEAWTSAPSLETSGEFKKDLSEMRESAPKAKEYMAWIENHKQVEVKNVPDNVKWLNLNFNDEACSKPDFDDSGWHVMNLPGLWENTIGEFDGVVWFRKTVEIMQQMSGQNLLLSLGPIDDMDRVYFNGELVGAGEINGIYQVNRVYEVPAKLVKQGVNTIAVRVVDNQGGGGMWGKKDQMVLSGKDNVSLNIAGDWKYLPVAEYMDGRFYLYDISKLEFFSKPQFKGLSPYLPVVLFNAMINPLLPYQIKGAIWYQGEANVGRAEQYTKLFPLMIQDWRKAWNIENFPFYYVQIAPYNYSHKDSTESAFLRESQTKAMKVSNTGMVVTLDIGNVNNIHPMNKLDVGKRLANWALAKNYGKNIPYLGPVYKSMKREGNSIKLQFDFTEGGLVAKDGKLKEFEVAGKDGKYVPASAKIVNNEVIVSSPVVSSPESVRYCWRNGAEASLFNGAGLPASVFRTEK